MQQDKQKGWIKFTIAVVVLALGLLGVKLFIPYRYLSDAVPEDAIYLTFNKGMIDKEWFHVVREYPDGEILDWMDGTFNHIYVSGSYVVIFSDSQSKVRSVTAYSPNGTLIYSYGVHPIVFDPENPPVTLSEAQRQYGAFHGERGTGAWFPVYITNDGMLIQFSLDLADKEKNRVYRIRCFPLNSKDLWDTTNLSQYIIYEREEE